MLLNSVFIFRCVLRHYEMHNMHLCKKCKHRDSTQSPRGLHCNVVLIRNTVLAQSRAFSAANLVPTVITGLNHSECPPVMRQTEVTSKSIQWWKSQHGPESLLIKEYKHTITPDNTIKQRHDIVMYVSVCH